MKVTLLRTLASVALLAGILSGTAASAQAQSNNDLIAATWKAGDTQYALEKKGTSTLVISGRICPGTWAVKGNTLTITPKKFNWKRADPCGVTRVLEVVNVTPQAMDLTEVSTRKELHLIKQ